MHRSDALAHSMATGPRLVLLHCPRRVFNHKMPPPRSKVWPASLPNNSLLVLPTRTPLKRSVSLLIYTTVLNTIQADPATLAPGNVHPLPIHPPMTPQSVLAGVHHPSAPIAYARYFILPRQHPYHGAPSFPSITFSVQGQPGPTLKSIMKGTHALDRAYDPPFLQCGFSRIKCAMAVRIYPSLFSFLTHFFP